MGGAPTQGTEGGSRNFDKKRGRTVTRKVQGLVVGENRKESVSEKSMGVRGVRVRVAYLSNKTLKEVD